MAIIHLNPTISSQNANLGDIIRAQVIKMTTLAQFIRFSNDDDLTLRLDQCSFFKSIFGAFVYTISNVKYIF